MSDQCTCYLGDPDDPTRDEEGCAACDREFWTWVAEMHGGVTVDEG